MTNDTPDGAPGGFPGLAAMMQAQADMAAELDRYKRIVDSLTADPNIGPVVDGSLRLHFPMRVVGPEGEQYTMVREAGGNLALVDPDGAGAAWSNSDDAPAVSTVVSHDDLTGVTPNQHHVPPSSATLSAHAASHITAGTDEIDGDQLDIDWSPTNYTPTTSPAQVTDLDHLTAHLAGIDAALATGAGVASQGDTLITHIESVTSVAEQLIAARTSDYRSVTVLNMHASSILYVGEDSGVGPTDGFELIGGASMVIFTEAAVWVEAEAGATFNVGYLESYIA